MMKLQADVGVVFAGGAGVRLGGCDKASLKVGGVLLGDNVAERLQRQAKALAYVAADANVGQFSSNRDMTFVGDILASNGERLGPAGGLLAALEWARATFGDEALLLTAPVDAPFFPDDLFYQLEAQRKGRCAAVARHGGRMHPVFGVWRAQLAPMVRQIVVDEGVRAMGRILNALEGVVVDIRADQHSFLNINTPEDLEAAQRLGEA